MIWENPPQYAFICWLAYLIFVLQYVNHFDNYLQNKYIANFGAMWTRMNNYTIIRDDTFNFTSAHHGTGKAAILPLLYWLLICNMPKFTQRSHSLSLLLTFATYFLIHIE
jgi:hypothetical protein